jgi:hypothetical protein
MIGRACKTYHGNEKYTQNFGRKHLKGWDALRTYKENVGKMDVNRQVKASVRWQAFVTMLMTIWLYKNREIVDWQTIDLSIKTYTMHY